MEISITLKKTRIQPTFNLFTKTSVFYTSPLENAKYSSEKENLIEPT